MSVPARLTHADLEINYGKANTTVITNLIDQNNQLLEFVDKHNVPNLLRELGAKVKKAHSLKSTVSAVVVGNRRAGKSSLNGHLMFDQSAILTSPLRVDDGLQHVTTSLTLVKHAKSFSVRLCPLAATTRDDIVKHADRFNELLLDENAERIILPEDVGAISMETLDFAEAALGRAKPHPYQDLLNTDSLIPSFEALGSLPDQWEQDVQYRFIGACCDLVASSPDFRLLAPFFVLEICASWLPQDVGLWDTPGLGDGRFTPLVKYALAKSDVIIPYQRGSAVASSTISKCFELLAEVDVKRLQTHPPMLLLFERPGKTELEAYRASWAGEPPSDEALAQAYCSDVRRAHYRNEVLAAAEVDCVGKVEAPELFNELRNTLLVQVDTCAPRVDGDAVLATTAVFHDRGLYQELLHRSNFRAMNVWVHASACFFFQARGVARARAKQQSFARTRKRFSINVQSLEDSIATVCDAVETSMVESWEDYIEASSSEAAVEYLPSFFHQWLSEHRHNVLSALRSEWTELISAALHAYQADAEAELLANGLSQLVVDELWEGLYAQISVQSFAEVPRRQADTGATESVIAIFNELANRADQLARDMHEGDETDEGQTLAKGLFEELKPKLLGVIQDWKPYLKSIATEINRVLKNCYETLQQPQQLNEAVRKELLALCLTGSKLMQKVISKPDAKPPTKTLALPLPKFCASPRDVPRILGKPNRSNNRFLDLTFDLVDEPFTARLEMPHRDQNVITVPMHAHPAIEDIITNFKQQSHERSADLALPPVIILGCQGGELIDTISATGYSLESEKRFHQRELKSVTALRILLVDEPTSWKANAFIDNLSATMLMFVVKTGNRYLSSAQLLDYCHLIGVWLAQDEMVDETTIKGPKLFVRIESTAKTFKEASSGIQLTPTSPARVFKGLEKALLDEASHLEQTKAAAILSDWAVEDAEELQALYPDLAGADLTNIMVASNKIPKGADSLQQLEALKKAIASPKFPKTVRDKVLEGLRVEVLSASPLAEGSTRKRWLAQKVSTLEKNREQNLRCNLRVRFHKSYCSTYEQTQCVLVNSAVVRGLWACTDQDFVKAALPDMEKSFVKSLRKAEGRITKALKTSHTKLSGDGGKPKKETISSGLCCLVVDQFCVNSDFRATPKPNKTKSSPSAKSRTQAPTRTQGAGKRASSASQGQGPSKKSTASTRK